MARERAPSGKSPEKLDLHKLHRDEYVTARKPTLVEVKPATYLTISGKGAPGSEEFQASIGALYSMAFTVKMTRKFEGRGDYTVCKLEGQWWSEAGGGDLSKVAPEEWRWRLLIRTPEFIMQDDVDKAVTALEKRGKSPLSREVRLETVAEGLCVQMLHVGPYDREKETVDAMLEFAEAKGLEPHGWHHEIYISDPRRIPPERLKTILRFPAVKASGKG